MKKLIYFMVLCLCSCIFCKNDKQQTNNPANASQLYRIDFSLYRKHFNIEKGIRSLIMYCNYPNVLTCIGSPILWQGRISEGIIMLNTISLREFANVIDLSSLVFKKYYVYESLQEITKSSTNAITVEKYFEITKDFKGLEITFYYHQSSMRLAFNIDWNELSEKKLLKLIKKVKNKEFQKKFQELLKCYKLNGGK